jgi:hypothetical protein
MLSSTQLEPHAETHHILLSANLLDTVLEMKPFHRRGGRQKPRKEKEM